MVAKKKKKINFSQSLKNLEEVVEQLENEELDLEKNLAHFEKGLKLIQDCQSYLKKAENKVQKIKLKFDSTDQPDTSS